MKKEYSNVLRYEKIELIKPEKRDELIAELRERTGLNIHRVSINEIDFLKDTAMISYYYYEK
jgi:predicted nucleic acid-binding protein